MASLDELADYLASQLKTASIPDYPGAMNGLQLANHGQVGRLVAAVDASLEVIEAAANGAAGLLIVHHGMFWQGAQPLTGAFYRKIKIAMDAGLAVYSSHLPLDVHPVWGNNLLLARAIDLQKSEPFLEHNGISAGIRGGWNGTRSDLLRSLEAAVAGPVHLCPGGGEGISKVGIITGGAGSEIAKVAASGIDTFITGEGPHWSYVLARELGINVLYGGHYATETFGVKAVAAALADRFDLAWDFVERPSGL